MLITEAITVGSPLQDGLFEDWVRQLEPYVAAGHHSYSPQKHIYAEYRGMRLAGGRLIRQKGRGRTSTVFEPRDQARKYSTPVALLQLGGRLSIQQQKRDCTLERGAFVFCDLARPCEIERSGDWETLAIQFPATTFQPSTFQQALAQPMRTDSPSDALMFNAACGFWDAAPTLDIGSQGLIFDILRSLTLLTTAFRVTPETCRNVRVDRAMAYIEQRLDDENLCAATVAAAQRVSRRHLDNCFTQCGPSIDAYIWDRRLTRAAEKLSQASLADRSLLEISLDLGFKSPSHFSKAFQGRFGISPRAYRHRALARQSLDVVPFVNEREEH